MDARWSDSQYQEYLVKQQKRRNPRNKHNAQKSQASGLYPELAGGTHYNTKIILAYFREMGLPEPETEFVFHPSRKWRFDFAWVPQKIALEVEGGTWSRGAHGRGSGIARDIEKYNSAIILGWGVLRVTPDNLCMAETVQMIREALN